MLRFRLRYGSIILVLLTCCTQLNMERESNPEFCNDDFNRSDSSSLGENWQVSGVNYFQASIINQNAVVNFSGGNYTFVACSRKVDQRKSFHATRLTALTTLPAQNHSLMLVARSKLKSAPSDGYFCGIDGTTNPKRLTIFKNSAGLRSDLSVSSSPITVIVGNQYLITFKLEYNQLSCELAGAVSDSLTVLDSTYVTGYSGVYGFAATPGTPISFAFDDFSIRIPE